MTKSLVSLFLISLLATATPAFADGKVITKNSGDMAKLVLRSDKMSEDQKWGKHPETGEMIPVLGSEITREDMLMLAEKYGDDIDKIKKEVAKLSAKRIKEQKERGIN